MGEESDRLQRLYAEFGDDELLRLAKATESLTDAAQFALTEELRRRKLSRPAPSQDADEAMHGERADGFDTGIPGVVPGDATAVETALKPGCERRDGMVALLSFYDGLQLSRACDALADAEIEPAIQPIGGAGTGTGPVRFDVWVNAEEVDRSKLALRAKLGLFPLAEADEIEESEALAELTQGEVGDFETAEEAEAMRALLAKAGFAASAGTDGEPDMDDKIWWTVKVEPHEWDRAMVFAATRLGPMEE
jgi:hypothetical protein